MSATILLTGGAGYIGAHTCVTLAEAGHRPVILDNFDNADRDTPERIARILGRPVPVIEADLRDAAALDRAFSEYRFDAVIHFAAKKAVGESVAEPRLYFDNNTGGLLALLKAMETHGVGRIVFSSSATVYGDCPVQPIPEDAPLVATNPYGLTKLMGEQILGHMGVAHPDWAIGILRYFNPAGVHPSGLLAQSPRSKQTPPENLMPRLLEVATGKREKLMVYGGDYDTPDGTGVRDYIHIDDLCRGHLLSLEKLLETGQGHTVNLGTGRGYSVLEMIAAFARASGREIPHEITDRRPGDVGTCYADVSRARALLGFEARLGLDEMCRDSCLELAAAA